MYIAGTSGRHACICVGIVQMVMDMRNLAV